MDEAETAQAEQRQHSEKKRAKTSAKSRLSRSFTRRRPSPLSRRPMGIMPGHGGHRTGHPL